MQGPHTCPRRLESPRYAGEVDLDVWESGYGLAGQNEAGDSCSYCGSLNPARFMELVDAGWWVDPTDKAYKAYLAEPLTEAQVAERRGQWMAQPFVAAVREAARRQNAADVDATVEKEWEQYPAARGHGQVLAKFYYQHLDDGQQQRFVDLVNDRTMKIGEPGYFYVPPFFTQFRDVAAG